MAATEYYLGTAAAREMGHQRPSNPGYSLGYSLQQQPQQPLQPLQQLAQRPHELYSPTPPPSYSAYPVPVLASQPQQPQSQAYPRPGGYQRQPNIYPSQTRPHPSSGLTTYPATPPGRPQVYRPQPPPPQQQSGYLGAPLQPTRSHSQPPRVRFADDYDSDSTFRSSSSDSDSARREHRHRKHRHSHSKSHHRHLRSDSSERDYDHGYDRDYDIDRPSRSHHHHHHHHHRETPTQKKEHKNRDTFLGAGAGGLIGDAIFPGLGSIGGLLLGGYGGRKHAEKRSRSASDGGGMGRREREDEWAKDGHWKHSRGGRDDGWDPESATFKKGHAVR